MTSPARESLMLISLSTAVSNCSSKILRSKDLGQEIRHWHKIGLLLLDKLTGALGDRSIFSDDFVLMIIDGSCDVWAGTHIALQLRSHKKTVQPRIKPSSWSSSSWSMFLRMTWVLQTSVSSWKKPLPNPLPAKGHKVQAWLSSHFQENISWFQLPEIPKTHPAASQGLLAFHIKNVHWNFLTNYWAPGLRERQSVQIHFLILKSRHFGGPKVLKNQSGTQS